MNIQFKIVVCVWCSRCERVEYQNTELKGTWNVFLVCFTSTPRNIQELVHWGTNHGCAQMVTWGARG